MSSWPLNSSERGSWPIATNTPPTSRTRVWLVCTLRMRTPVTAGGEIIGIVGNVKQVGLADSTTPATYLPFNTLPVSDMSVLETRVKVDETDVARIHIGDPAEIQIDARYISYVRAGDRARIKLDAFPFQQYGVIEGRVRTVSEDAFVRTEGNGDERASGREAFYLARVAFEDLSGLHGVPEDSRFLPGMTVTAEVIFGDRTVMSYLLYPIMRSLDEALRSP